jgi:hypothetical protein
MHETGVRIELCLVSHTNAGKTTLARTLLGRDVGEVRDSAHVTQTADAHELLATDAGDRLILWDTPGFGDSARLHKRLSASAQPLGWFLSHVWDRWTDQAFFLSQEAMRAARDSADVVLYLVNVTEEPAEAGYLMPELKLLAWLDKPVIVLLNQTGQAQDPRQPDAELARWAGHLRDIPVVRDVLPLDAFTRCWVHEHAFFQAVGKWIGDAKKAGYRRLQQTWQQRNIDRFARAMDVVAGQIADAARERQIVAPHSAWAGIKGWLAGRTGPEPAQRLSHRALTDMLTSGRSRTTRELLALHGLQGKSEDPFLKGLDAADLESRTPLDPVRAGIGGALASGGASGLAADLASGGLTLGTGALLGAIGGALLFALGAEGSNRARGTQQESVRLSDAALRGLLQDALLKYVAIAHFGRGRGDFRQESMPESWIRQSQQIIAAEAPTLDHILARIRSDGSDTHARNALGTTTRSIALDILAWLYPDADIDAVRRTLQAAHRDTPSGQPHDAQA